MHGWCGGGPLYRQQGRCLFSEQVNATAPEARVRLSAGANALEGRVEVLDPDEGRWGAVCGNDWDDAGAAVVCRTLGYLGGRGTSEPGAPSGSSRGPTVRCTGLEMALEDCSFVRGGGRGCSGGYARTQCERGAQLHVMGRNAPGALGLGASPGPSAGEVVGPEGKDVTAVALGPSHSAFVAGGDLFVMGSNGAGELGLGPEVANRSAPARVVAPNGRAVATVAVGGRHSAFVAGGQVYVMGANDAGQLALGHTRPQSRPRVLSLVLPPVTAAALGARHSLFLTAAGRTCSFEDPVPLGVACGGLWTASATEGGAEAAWRLAGGSEGAPSAPPGLAAPGGRRYAFVEASGARGPGAVAYLVSEQGRYDAVGFRFHMSGAHTGALAVWAEGADERWSQYWARQGPQHDARAAPWGEAWVAFDRPVRRVRFEAVPGAGPSGDTAVADVALHAAGAVQRCEFDAEAFRFCDALWVSGAAPGARSQWRRGRAPEAAPAQGPGASGPRDGPASPARYALHVDTGASVTPSNAPTSDADAGASYVTSAAGDYTAIGFRYLMYGPGVRALVVAAAVGTGQWAQLWRCDGQQHNSSAAAWTETVVYFARAVQRVRFEAVPGSGARGDTAISDVVLYSSGGGGGRVYVAGDNSAGQLGLGHTDRALVLQPVPVPNGKAVSAIAAGPSHSAFVAGGALYMFGDNEYGQLGVGLAAAQRVPRRVPAPNGAAVTHVALGPGGSAFIAGGRLYVVGAPPRGLGPGAARVVFPVPVDAPGGGPVTAVALGREHGLFMAGGRLYGAGSNADGQFGAVGPELPRPQLLRLPEDGAVACVAAGPHASAFVLRGPARAAAPPDPGLSARDAPLTEQWYVMGRNTDGELGLGHAGAATAPQPIASPSGAPIEAFAFGRAHGAFLAGGRVYAMGSNAHGQLGRGPHAPASRAPQHVAAPNGAPTTAVAAGDYHTAFMAGGALYTCGRNAEGQLGLGHTAPAPRPERVVPPNGGAVTAVAAGGGAHGVRGRGGAVRDGQQHAGAAGAGGGRCVRHPAAPGCRGKRDGRRAGGHAHGLCGAGHAVRVWGQRPRRRPAHAPAPARPQRAARHSRGAGGVPQRVRGRGRVLRDGRGGGRAAGPGAGGGPQPVPALHAALPRRRGPRARAGGVARGVPHGRARAFCVRGQRGGPIGNGAHSPGVRPAGAAAADAEARHGRRHWGRPHRISRGGDVHALDDRDPRAHRDRRGIEHGHRNTVHCSDRNSPAHRHRKPHRDRPAAVVYRGCGRQRS